jgi:hypothetical protein
MNFFTFIFHLVSLQFKQLLFFSGLQIKFNFSFPPKFFMNYNLNLMNNSMKFNNYCKKLLDGCWDTLPKSNLGSNR